ncbi:hypothetical protein PspLS_00429, partial [Pyricularia sp. CBS 133598]
RTPRSAFSAQPDPDRSAVQSAQRARMPWESADWRCWGVQLVGFRCCTTHAAACGASNEVSSVHSPARFTMMPRVHPPDAGDESLGKHQDSDIYCRHAVNRGQRAASKDRVRLSVGRHAATASSLTVAVTVATNKTDSSPNQFMQRSDILARPKAEPVGKHHLRT